MLTNVKRKKRKCCFNNNKLLIYKIMYKTVQRSTVQNFTYYSHSASFAWDTSSLSMILWQWKTLFFLRSRTLYTLQYKHLEDLCSKLWVHGTILRSGCFLVHLLMERPCRLAVDTGKGWHREHGHGMPGKCLYELAKFSGSFSKLGIGGAWKPRYPADDGEWGPWAVAVCVLVCWRGVELTAAAPPAKECKDWASGCRGSWDGAKTGLGAWFWATLEP